MSRPSCTECGDALVCPGCDDPRPAAKAVDIGWTLLTPLGRWESVTDVNQPEPFGPVLIKTVESGDFLWRYRRTDQVDAFPPRFTPHGTPEVRIIEGNWRGAAVYAFACLDTEVVDIPTGVGILAFGHKPDREPGWRVHIYVDGRIEIVAVPNKDGARSTVRAAGRRAARKLGVKFRITKPA